MKWLRKTAFSLCLLALSTAAMADKYTTGVNIEYIEALGDGGFILRSAENISTSGCYESGRLFKAYLSGGLTEAGAKTLLSVALTAYSLVKPVDIYHGETQNCLVSKIRIRQ